MYRLEEIQHRLSNLVGWRMPFSPQDGISHSLTESESGLYFQDAHPLVTIENIKSIMPDDFNEHYFAWNESREYKKGEKVAHGELIYIAKKDNVGQEPTASDFNGDYNADFGNPYWKPFNPLNDFLEYLTNSGIAAVIQKFTQIKKLNMETRSIMERKTFFDGAGRIKETIANNGRLVGYEIVPVRSMGVTAKIERVGFQGVGGSGKITLYLFHSSQVNPVRTFDLHYTKSNGTFEWFDLKDCYLPYISDETNAGGSWYLCYNQDDLPRGLEAINYARDWSREPCGTCNRGSLELWRELSKYMQVSPFMTSASKTFKKFPEMWDLQDNIFTNTINYGLNCEISVGCDLSDFIIRQRHIFQTALQLQVASAVLRTLAMNPNVRVNRNQSNVTRMDILYELDGNTAGMRANGMGHDLQEAYKAIDLDTRGLDRICLSCNNHGVIYSSI